METKIFDKLESLPEEYDLIFRIGSKKSFFLTRSRFEVLARTTLARDEELQLYGVEEDSGAPIILLPARVTSVMSKFIQQRTLSSP